MSRTERKGTPTLVADLPALIGQEIGVSRWITVDQARIDAFAEVTEDRQFIHIDPEAARATPFGGTIAHGFLTLSLLSAMTYDAVPPLEGVVMGVNYGFDRLRFLAPVLAGSQVRGRFRVDVDELAVLGDLGEGVDAGLVDLDPAADPDLLADQSGEVGGRRRDALAFGAAHGVRLLRRSG